MKFATLVIAAIFTSSFASVGAADANGYTGSEYTFMGEGWCVDASNVSYGNSLTNLPLPATLDECAAHCLAYPSTEGLVGLIPGSR